MPNKWFRLYCETVDAYNAAWLRRPNEELGRLAGIKALVLDCWFEAEGADFYFIDLPRGEGRGMVPLGDGRWAYRSGNTLYLAVPHNPHNHPINPVFCDWEKTIEFAYTPADYPQRNG